jgi:quercetin 2,3-dioxygenase
MTDALRRPPAVAPEFVGRARRRGPVLGQGERSGRFVTLASGFAEDTDALPIRTNARVLGATMKAGETAEYPIGVDRHGYLVPAIGTVEVNGTRLEARDGAAIADEAVLRVTAIEDAEIVLVDAA